MTPQRAVIMSVRPDGTDLQVVERGVRNGEGLAVAPNGTVWTAVNERDNIPYPSHRAFGTYGDAFGQVIQAYVNEHPPDEVVPVTPGRDLGWPYCDPDQDDSSPAGSLADIPLVANATTNPNGTALDCAKLAPIEVGLPAHSAPLGMSFLEGSKLPAPWSGGAVIAVHGSWDRHPPRAPAVEWLAWNAPGGTLTPAVTLVGGFELPNGSYWGRPADAVPGPDGALYVSDDTARRHLPPNAPHLAHPPGRACPPAATRRPAQRARLVRDAQYRRVRHPWSHAARRRSAVAAAARPVGAVPDLLRLPRQHLPLADGRRRAPRPDRQGRPRPPRDRRQRRHRRLAPRASGCTAPPAASSTATATTATPTAPASSTDPGWPNATSSSPWTPATSATCAPSPTATETTGSGCSARSAP